MFRSILLVGLLVVVQNSAHGQSEVIRNPDGSFTSSSVYVNEPKVLTTFRVFVIDPKKDDTGYYAQDANGLLMPDDPKPKPDTSVYNLQPAQFYAWKKNMQKWADKTKYEFKEVKGTDLYFVSSALAGQQRAERAKEAAKRERNPFVQPQTQNPIPRSPVPVAAIPQQPVIPQQPLPQFPVQQLPQQQFPQQPQYIPAQYPVQQPYVPPKPVVTSVVEPQEAPQQPDWWENYKNGSIIVGIISAFLLVVLVAIKMMNGN